MNMNIKTLNSRPHPQCLSYFRSAIVGGLPSHTFFERVSHFDSMTTSFLYLTYLPHPTQKKKPWSSSMHEYYVSKIVCHHFGSSQINGKGCIRYIPNIIITSQSFPTFIQKFDLGWCFESCNGCKGKWFENNWVDNIKDYKTELWH
jgi:hypothetical protein